MDAQSEIAHSIGAFLINILYYVWPFVAYVILYPFAKNCLLGWRNWVYEHSIKWCLLELRIPREIRKSPKAMEQVLIQLHALRNLAGNLQETYVDGEVSEWYSFEVVSFGGEIHFYVRTTRKRKNLVEAAFFSYYPDVEIEEVDDYVSRFPKTIQELQVQGLDMYGGELILSKEGLYPIRSYEEFEAPDEERQYDPISVLLEFLGKIKPEETIGIQFLAQPAGPDWKEEFEEIVDKLKEQKRKKPEKASSGLSINFPEGGPLPVFEPKETKKEEMLFNFQVRSPGETDVLKAVEENISKQAFEMIIRFMYISPVELFYDTFARRGIPGCFNQYAALDLNSFRLNLPTTTRTLIWSKPYIFPKIRSRYKKQRILYNYRHREMVPETFMGRLVSSHFFNMNFDSKKFLITTKSLATIFHPPTALVLTAPFIKRVESRKAGPPAGLAIYGSETEIEQFK